ncbi:MAG: gliding motility-associated C-terminal domain-containing protein [Bacteroidota bacterium]
MKKSYFHTNILIFICLAFPFTAFAQCVPPIIINFIQTQQVTCYGDCDGQAFIDTSGGAGNYSFLWDDPQSQTANFATGLCADTFNVTVTDTSGCDTIISIPIIEDSLLTATISPTNISCNGACDGQAEANPSLPMPTYLWDDDSSQTSKIATGLCPGFYTVLVTMGTCYTTATVTITEPPLLTASITSSANVSCNAYCDGDATVSPSGGTTPYTYLWSPGGGTSATATGLCAGTYDITVTDANDCDTTISIIISEPSVLTTIITGTNATCNGVCDGTASVSPSGGTSPYTYSWDNNAGNSQLAVGLCIGTTYTVTITDNKGCTATGSFTPAEQNPLTGNIDVTDVQCGNANTGTATVSISNGTAPYTYLWRPSGQTTALATDLSEGTYTITITDNDGCIAADDVIITKEECEIFPYNTFTPNGDDINDTWEIMNISDYPGCEIKVYNRWGELVFSSVEYIQEWDGRSMGIDLPAAVYYYVITVKSADKTFAGSVTIVR